MDTGDMTMRIVSKLCGRWGAVLGLLAAGLFLAGCQSGKPDPRFSDLPGLPAGPGGKGAQNQGMPAVVGGQSDYTNSEILNPSDSIRIIYSDTPAMIPPFEDQIRA